MKKKNKIDHYPWEWLRGGAWPWVPDPWDWPRPRRSNVYGSWSCCRRWTWAPPEPFPPRSWPWRAHVRAWPGPGPRSPAFSGRSWTASPVSDPSPRISRRTIAVAFFISEIGRRGIGRDQLGVGSYHRMGCMGGTNCWVRDSLTRSLVQRLRAERYEWRNGGSLFSSARSIEGGLLKFS